MSIQSVYFSSRISRRDKTCPDKAILNFPLPFSQARLSFSRLSRLRPRRRVGQRADLPIARRSYIEIGESPE